MAHTIVVAEDVIGVLAAYLTGPEVEINSMALRMPAGGVMKLKESAVRFFALRKAFGIEGYTDVHTAADLIRRAIESGAR